jgi:hypothetical protein
MQASFTNSAAPDKGAIAILAIVALLFAWEGVLLLMINRKLNNLVDKIGDMMQGKKAAQAK